MSTPNENAKPLSDHCIETLADIGGRWASHGLAIAQGALLSSARTLQATADLLGTLSAEVRSGTATREEACQPSERAEAPRG
jgi:hypothetical protein